MTACLYFDNLKFDIFDAMVFSGCYHVVRGTGGFPHVLCTKLIYNHTLVQVSTLHDVGSKESISKFLKGNRFYVKLCILSPYSNRSFDDGHG